MLNQATLDYISAHAHDDVRRLALGPAPAQGVDLHAALQQIEGRRLATSKLPTWAAHPHLHFPPRLAMEQCSSEATAIHKVEVLKEICTRPGLAPEGETSMVDLTGGFGVDFSFLARPFARATYVERQAGLCTIAAHNLPLLGLPHARVVNAEATAFLKEMPPVDVIYLDPARRDAAGRKTVAIANCEPNLAELLPTLRAKSRLTLVKLSPMLHIAQALQALPGIAHVEVVSADGECKELLLCIPSTPLEGTPTLRAVNLLHDGTRHTFTFTPGEEAGAPCPCTPTPRRYLYEPNASVLKAGAYRSVAARFGLEKLHPNSHLYTSDTLVAGFPGRTFRVQAASRFGRKELKALLQGVEQANLTVRNFPARTDELRRRLRLREGGHTYLFATTLADGCHALLRCVKPG